MAFPIPDIYRHPTVRTSMLAIFAFGFSGATTSPYQSVVGIKELGLGDGAYSAIMASAAAVNVLVSLLVGNFADRLGEYRRMMLVVCLFGILGYGAIYLVPTQAVFVGAALLVLPVYGALNSLLFANVRAVTRDMPGETIAEVNSGVRAMISLSWVLVPGLTGVLLAQSSTMLPAYLFAALAVVACLGLIAFAMPKVKPTEMLVINHMSYWAALAHVMSPRIAVRVLAVALVTGMLHVNGVVQPLIVVGPAGGKVSDIGVLVGIVALLEVAFILVLGRVVRRFGAMPVLAAGTGLYVLYLILLGLSSAPWHLYALTLISGAGAAALISIPITYLQDLIADRPGLGSALISVNMFLSAGLGALLFALGTAVGTYSLASIIGGAAGAIGISLLILLDGFHPRSVA